MLEASWLEQGAGEESGGEEAGVITCQIARSLVNHSEQGGQLQTYFYLKPLQLVCGSALRPQ